MTSLMIRQGTYGLLLSLGVLLCGWVQANGPGSPIDSAHASPDFSEHFLFEHTRDLSPEALEKLEDSLRSLEPVPWTLVHKVERYRTLENLSKAEVVTLIDSLFSLDTVPHRLVNMIRLYTARLENPVTPRSFLHIPDNNTLFPADHYYGTWNTEKVNPYPPTLFQQDNRVELCLRDEAANCHFQMPLKGKLTSPFGMRDGRHHNGVDIDLQVGDEVRAAFPGRVRFAGWYGGYGRVVVIRHFNGLETVYAHLHRYGAKTGEPVEAGQVVGFGGSSGHSTGSHLHFEVRFRGIPIDPHHLITFDDQDLVADTLILERQKWSYAAFPKGVEFHTVERGDFLYKIAKQYNIPMEKICRWNGIRRNTVLQVGQKLRISS